MIHTGFFFNSRRTKIKRITRNINLHIKQLYLHSTIADVKVVTLGLMFNIKPSITIYYKFYNYICAWLLSSLFIYRTIIIMLFRVLKLCKKKKRNEFVKTSIKYGCHDFIISNICTCIGRQEMRYPKLL